MLRLVGPWACTTRSPWSSETLSDFSKVTHTRGKLSQAGRSSSSCRRCPPVEQTSSTGRPLGRAPLSMP